MSLSIVSPLDGGNPSIRRVYVLKLSELNERTSIRLNVERRESIVIWKLWGSVKFIHVLYHRRYSSECIHIMRFCRIQGTMHVYQMHLLWRFNYFVSFADTRKKNSDQAHCTTRTNVNAVWWILCVTDMRANIRRPAKIRLYNKLFPQYRVPR